MKPISIIMGSDSDLPVMQEAAKILEHLGLDYELTIISAHRTPERMKEGSKSLLQELEELPTYPEW
jgi:5-(carboxyamino)imidazole ribonucleotide mutase